MIWELFTIITKGLTWFFQINKEKNDNIRVSYEGIAVMYDRLVKTIDDRLQETDKKLHDTMIEFECCRRDRLLHESKVVEMANKVTMLQIQINDMEKEMSDLRDQRPF